MAAAKKSARAASSSSAPPAETPARARLLLARAFPWALALTLAAPFAAPFWLNASVVTAVGLLLGAVFAVAGLAVGRRDLGAPATVAAGAVALAAALFAAASFFSASPLISLVGAVGQHNGAALWVLAAVWLLAGVLCADARSLRETLIAVAVAATVHAAAALAEVAARGAERTQGFAAGRFENSTSLGEFLAVGIVAALAWALTARRGWERALASALVAGLAVGVVLSESRTGLVGVLAAGAFAAVLALRPPRGRAVAAFAAVPPLAAVALTVLGVAASMGSLGARALSLVSAVGTDRDVLWRSAFAQILQTPLVGSGLEQFSAWVELSSAGGNGAFDPHNVVLAVTLGGGVVGLLVAGCAVVALVFALVAAASERPRSLAVALVAAMPVVLIGEGLVAWITPAAALAVCAACGAMLGVSAPAAPPPTRPASRPRVRSALVAAAGCVAAGALALGVLTSAALPTMLAYIAAQRSPDPTTLAEQYRRWPDPAYAVLAIRQFAPAASDPASAEQLRALLLASSRDVSWRVDSAAAHITATQALSSPDAASLAAVVTLAEQGAHADPTSGLWWVLAASAANRAGLAPEARQYATRALQYPLPADLRSSMEAFSRP